MKPESLSIAIFDGGDAGPALAEQLARLGHRPRLFDTLPAQPTTQDAYFDALIVAWAGARHVPAVVQLAEQFPGAYVILAVPPSAVRRAAGLLDQGVDRYLVYPYLPDEVQAVLRRVIGRRMRIDTPISIAVDDAGSITYVAREAESLLKYPPGALLGRSVEEVYEEGRVEAERVLYAVRHSSDHRIDGFLTALRDAENNPVPILLSAEALFDENGQYAGSVGFFSDDGPRDLRIDARQGAAELRREAGHYAGIARVMAGQLDAEACLVLRYDHLSDRLAAVSCYGLSSNEAEAVTDAFPVEGVLAEAFEAAPPTPQRAVVAGDPPEELQPLAPRSRYGRVHNYLAVPLTDHTDNVDQPLGVLLLLNKLWRDSPATDPPAINRGGFSWIDEAWARLLGEDIVELLHLRFHSRALEALLAVENGLGSDRDRLLQQIAETLVDKIGYRTAYIRLLRPDDSLRIWAAAGAQTSMLVPDMTDPGELSPFQTTPRGRGIVGRVAAEGKHMVVRDVLLDDNFHHRDLARKAGWRGMLAVPIRLQERTIGVLVCYTGRPYTFSRSDITLVQTFAHLAGLVVSTSIMTISRGEDLSLIKNLLLLARGEPNEKTLWGSVLMEIMDHTGAKYGSINKIDREAGLVRPVVGRGFSAKVLALEFPINGRSILGWVAQHSRHALIKDIEAEPRWKDIYRKVEGDTRAELAVPIFHGPNPTYIINLESDQPDAFGAEDLLRLEALNILPRIIEQNELLRAPYDRQSMRSQATRAAIHQLFKLMREEDLSTAHFQQVILEQAVKIVGGHMGSIHMIDETGKYLVLKAAYPPERFEMLREKAGNLPLDTEGDHRGIVVRAVEYSKAYLVDDVHDDEDYLEVDSGSRSALAVYLGDGENILGTIYVEHRERGHFKAEHRDTLIALADLAVIALGVPEQAERRLRELEKLSALRRLNFFKAIESVWLHSAKGLIGAASQDIKNFLVSQNPKYLRRAQTTLTELDEMLNRYTGWGPQVVEEQNLRAMLSQSVATWRSTIPDVEFIYDESLSAAPVLLSLDWITFYQALTSLVLNARAAFLERGQGGSPQDAVAITVDVNEQITLTIDDNGPGIPSDLVGLLGQILPDELRPEKGGWGSYAVATYVRDTLQGEMRWENRKSGGARVTIMLPLLSGKEE